MLPENNLEEINNIQVELLQHYSRLVRFYETHDKKTVVNSDGTINVFITPSPKSTLEVKTV